jgi:hypothetical protein
MMKKYESVYRRSDTNAFYQREDEDDMINQAKDVTEIGRERNPGIVRMMNQEKFKRSYKEIRKCLREALLYLKLLKLNPADVRKEFKLS